MTNRCNCAVFGRK